MTNDLLNSVFFLLLLTGIALPAGAGVRAEGGTLSSADLAGLSEQWGPELKEALLTNVYSDRFNTYVKPCGEDPAAGVPALTIPGEGFDLQPRHGDDLTCALAEAGVVIIATRSSGGGLEALTAIRDGEALLILEVSRDDSGAIAEVTSMAAPDQGVLVLRPRPPEAASFSRFAQLTEQIVSQKESLNAIRALLGQAEFDLSAVGIGLAPGETSPADEPGCAETGACAVAACAPMNRDNSILSRQLYPEEDKAELICPRLAKWQTDRHPETPPDQKLVRRALILALQTFSPEQDLSNGVGRVVIEHSLSGTRAILFSTIVPELFTTPIMATTVGDVSGVVCRGNARQQRCRAQALIEATSRVVNLPPGTPQAVLLETIGFPSRSYTLNLDLRFERRNARWELEDPDAVGASLMELSDARVEKGMADYLIEKLGRLPRQPPN